jgi:hypothetical protein
MLGSVLPSLPPPDTRLRRLLRLGVYVAPLGIATLLGVPICPTALVPASALPGLRHHARERGARAR